MDKPNNVNSSSADASVSNIPTATPIASEIISDFEPDPKFDITPLEKATFDCNDLLLQESNLSELVQHSENGHQAEIEPQRLDKEQVSHDSGVDAPNEHQDKTAETQSQVGTNSQASATEMSQTLSSDIRGDSDLLSSSSIEIPKINDCPSSFDKNDNDADHLTATISLDESIAATALVEVAERADALGSHNTKDSDHNRQQYSAITTSQKTGQVHTQEENITANYLFSNSQTSVDALRDKVIESALELGEAHDFPHAPIHVEDKEKLFETIHREVTSIHSSIDLIADVASQQQSIEINTAEPPVQQESVPEPSFDHSTKEQKKDLITEGQLSSPSKEDEQSPELQPGRGDAKQQVTDLISDQQGPLKESQEESNEEEAAEPVEEIVCETVNPSEVDRERSGEILESRMEPIIEEPPTNSNVFVSEVLDKNEHESKEPKKVLADIIVEPLTSADESAEPLNLEPVIEEASSNDEQEQTDKVKQVEKKEEKVQAESDERNETEDTAEKVPLITTETTADENVGSPKSEAVSLESVSNEGTGRRKSGRRVKAPRSIDEQPQPQPQLQPKVEETRRGSRRISSRKIQEDTEKPVKCIEPAQRNQSASGPKEEDPTLEERSVIKIQEELAPNPHEEQKQEPKCVIDDDEKIESMEVDQTRKEPKEKVEACDQPDPKAVEEAVGRSGRSLRVKAPKRKLEEETPDPEPPKKQVKRSRLSNDQLNRSTALARGTSIIKLPALKSRMTISTSDPSSRPGARRELASMPSPATDKKYLCKECGFATDRLDNIVYHNTKILCQGKSAMAEMMKNDIIKQQQSKSKRRQAR